jgi:uncharacterized protein YegL
MASQLANGQDMDIIKNFICCTVFTESLTKFGSTAQAQPLLLTITQKISTTDKQQQSCYRPGVAQRVPGS